MTIHLLVLNYNGRALLEECLPSVLAAAQASRWPCEVIVVDNDSTDDSIEWLAEHCPTVRVIRCANHGLSSYNEIVPRLPGRIAILLNNDIKLDPQAIDLLVEPLAAGEPGCFMTAPSCRRFDGTTYEGFRTAVRWRWGLVEATALYPGHEATIDLPGWTASAGAALAVDRDVFAALGGFDPVYLPGRLEDLDFALRGFLAGYHARYVPEAKSWHRGMATFGQVFGSDGCDRLALRNTLLFQWKNLRHPGHFLRQLVGLPIRLGWDVVRAAWTPRGRRWAFVGALIGALARVGQLHAPAFRRQGTLAREQEYFRLFHPASQSSDAGAGPWEAGNGLWEATPAADSSAPGNHRRQESPPTNPNAGLESRTHRIA